MFTEILFITFLAIIAVLILVNTVGIILDKYSSFFLTFIIINAIGITFLVLVGILLLLIDIPSELPLIEYGVDSGLKYANQIPANISKRIKKYRSKKELQSNLDKINKCFENAGKVIDTNITLFRESFREWTKKIKNEISSIDEKIRKNKAFLEKNKINFNKLSSKFKEIRTENNSKLKNIIVLIKDLNKVKSKIEETLVTLEKNKKEYVSVLQLSPDPEPLIQILNPMAIRFKNNPFKIYNSINIVGDIEALQKYIEDDSNSTVNNQYVQPLFKEMSKEFFIDRNNEDIKNIAEGFNTNNLSLVIWHINEIYDSITEYNNSNP